MIGVSISYHFWYHPMYYVMFSQIVKELAENEGVTEQLKAENQMLWVQRMNNIRSRATEIVNAELIYT